MIDMAGTLYIPAIIRYTKELAVSINDVKAACETADVSVQTKLLIRTSSLLSEAQKALEDLRKLDAKANGKTTGKEMAVFFRQQVCPAMEALRKPIDELEMIVDRRLWPVPTYAELLYDM